MDKADMSQRWGVWGKCLCRAARQMVGVPDYATYVDHMRITHPGAPVMSYADFFRDRQSARYGERNGGMRCC